MESYRERGKFKTKFLATRQLINPTQAPSLSAASEGLQDRKKYNASSIYIVNLGPARPRPINWVFLRDPREPRQLKL